MNNTVKTLLILVGILIATMTLAQSSEKHVKEEMDKLNFMIGEWEGGGWMMNQDRTKSGFTQSEKIEMDLNGAVLVIHGQGWNTDGHSIHNALGIISYNAKEEKYSMLAMLEDGQQTKAELELVSKNQIKWWFSVPSGTIKYQLAFERDTWVEKGEFSPDENVWYPFIEFTLTKKQ